MISHVSEQPSNTNGVQTKPSPGWRGELHLDFQARQDAHEQLERTVLRFEHQGPLRIQKALYPDGLKCCHAIVIHPPGGIASGDHLAITVDVAQNAQALITTPSATKWYGAFGHAAASQQIDMHVTGHLQWLPAETIVFDGAVVDSTLSIDVADTGSMVGWDTLIFGRHGAGERYLRGCFDQSVRLSLGEGVVWIDRLRLIGNDLLFDSPLGLQGHHALATCWLVTPQGVEISHESLAALREYLPAIAFTRIHSRVLVGRLLAEPIVLRAQLEAAWQWLNTHLFEQATSIPRLWAT